MHELMYKKGFLCAPPYSFPHFCIRNQIYTTIEQLIEHSRDLPETYVLLAKSAHTSSPSRLQRMNKPRHFVSPRSSKRIRAVLHSLIRLHEKSHRNRNRSTRLIIVNICPYLHNICASGGTPPRMRAVPVTLLVIISALVPIWFLTAGLGWFVDNGRPVT